MQSHTHSRQLPPDKAAGPSMSDEISVISSEPEDSEVSEERDASHHKPLSKETFSRLFNMDESYLEQPAWQKRLQSEHLQYIINGWDPLKRIVQSPIFGLTISVVIIFNAVQIGFETDGALPYAFSSIIETSLLIVYSIEILLRLGAYGLSNLGDRWFRFDFLIVLVTLLSTTVVGQDVPASSQLSVLRILRLVRLVRIVRLLQFCKELLLLVSSMIAAMRTVVWMWLLLIMIIYVFSIIFCVEMGHQYPDDAYVQELWGSISRSSFTLFAVLTLEGWVDIARNLFVVSPGMGFMLIFFVSITTYAIMSVVQAVIVQGVLEDALNSHDARLKKVETETQERMRLLFKILRSEDTDHDGTISEREYQIALNDTEFRKVLHSMEIDVEDFPFLYEQIDLHRTGNIEIAHFVKGLVQMRGTARARRLFELHCDIERYQTKTENQIERMRQTMEQHFFSIMSAMDQGQSPKSCSPKHSTPTRAFLKEQRKREKQLSETRPAFRGPQEQDQTQQVSVERPSTVFNQGLKDPEQSALEANTGVVDGQGLKTPEKSALEANSRVIDHPDQGLKNPEKSALDANSSVVDHPDHGFKSTQQCVLEAPIGRPGRGLYDPLMAVLSSILEASSMLEATIDQEFSAAELASTPQQCRICRSDQGIDNLWVTVKDGFHGLQKCIEDLREKAGPTSAPQQCTSNSDQSIEDLRLTVRQGFLCLHMSIQELRESFAVTSQGTRQHGSIDPRLHSTSSPPEDLREKVAVTSRGLQQHGIGNVHPGLHSASCRPVEPVDTTMTVPMAPEIAQGRPNQVVVARSSGNDCKADEQIKTAAAFSVSQKTKVADRKQPKEQSSITESSMARELKDKIHESSKVNLSHTCSITPASDRWRNVCRMPVEPIEPIELQSDNVAKKVKPQLRVQIGPLKEELAESQGAQDTAGGMRNDSEMISEVVESQPDFVASAEFKGRRYVDSGWQPDVKKGMVDSECHSDAKKISTGALSAASGTIPGAAETSDHLSFVQSVVFQGVQVRRIDC